MFYIRQGQIHFSNMTCQCCSGWAERWVILRKLMHRGLYFAKLIGNILPSAALSKGNALGRPKTAVLISASVCMYMYVHGYMCMSMYSYVSACLPRLSPNFLFETRSLTNMELFSWLECLANKAKRFSCLPASPALGFQMFTAMPRFIR